MNHFQKNLYISWRLAVSSFKSLVHAFIPDAFESSTENLITELRFLYRM